MPPTSDVNLYSPDQTVLMDFVKDKQLTHFYFLHFKIQKYFCSVNIFMPVDRTSKVYPEGNVT